MARIVRVFHKMLQYNDLANHVLLAWCLLYTFNRVPSTADTGGAESTSGQLRGFYLECPVPD
jgi:hypothetical protein